MGGITNGGLSISGSGSENAGVTIGHSNILTAAGTRSGSSGSVGFGGTISIPSISYDINGHITSTTTTSVTLPANPVPANPVSVTYSSTATTYFLGTTLGSNGSISTAYRNSNVYMKGSIMNFASGATISFLSDGRLKKYQRKK